MAGSIESASSTAGASPGGLPLLLPETPWVREFGWKMGEEPDALRSSPRVAEIR